MFIFVASLRYIIVTDTNVGALYAHQFETALRAAAIAAASTASSASASASAGSISTVPTASVATSATSAASAIPRVATYTMPAGERHKTRATKERIEDWMLAAERACNRDTCVVALGGGVVGDMAGFVAATFARGVPFVQVCMCCLLVHGSVSLDFRLVCIDVTRQHTWPVVFLLAKQNMF